MDKIAIHKWLKADNWRKKYNAPYGYILIEIYKGFRIEKWMLHQPIHYIVSKGTQDFGSRKTLASARLLVDKIQMREAVAKELADHYDLEITTEQSRRMGINPRRPSPESSGIHIDIGSHNARRNPKSAVPSGYVKIWHPITHRTKVVPLHSGIATCGHCHRSWDDTISTSITPVPAGRCPFEYMHTKRNPMPKRRRTVTIRRPAHAKRYGAEHPYFSKLPIHVQESAGAAWRTVAAFVPTTEGIKRAKQYAGIWKRERGARVKVRVIDIR